MKIVYLAAGAAGMYCGSCLHDNTLAAALTKLGEEVLLVPTYTPLRTDEESVSESQLFFGGINVFLQQHVPLFRHTPWFLDAVLDHPGMIRWVTRGGPSVEAEKLGELTVSMIEGELGRQRKEVQKLVHWIEKDAKPDVVHLSNTMLIGVAAEIRKRGIPVVSTLSGEDIFLERIPQPHYQRARASLRERAAQLDGFVALNHFYADYMADYLDVPRERIHVIRHGLNLAGHGTRQPSADGDLRTIGFLARICEDKGLHNLLAAAEQLRRDPEVPRFCVRAAGYLGKLDRAYLKSVEDQAAAWPPGMFAYQGELTRAEKISFLQGLDLMCLPTVYRESKGISALEALANAVPLVLPDHGAFPELLEHTQGGVAYQANSTEALATTLKQMLVNPTDAAAMGARGQAVIHREFTAEEMAQQHRMLYLRLLRS